jgi:hypothetical protein
MNETSSTRTASAAIATVRVARAPDTRKVAQTTKKDALVEDCVVSAIEHDKPLL